MICNDCRSGDMPTTEFRRGKRADTIHLCPCCSSAAHRRGENITVLRKRQSARTVFPYSFNNDSRTSTTLRRNVMSVPGAGAAARRGRS